MIEVVPFEPEMAAAVTACYNEAIEPVPDCHPVPVDRFAALDSISTGRLREERMMVARMDGLVVGFVHVGIAVPLQEHDCLPGEPTALRFLSYRVGQREVGRRLLAWVDDYARKRERSAIVAWHNSARYPFYHCAWAHLSARMAHIRALHGMYGYEEAGETELYFHWHEFEPPPPEMTEIEVELQLQWMEGALGSRMELRAMRGGEELGLCQMDRGQSSPSPNASDWCYCDWLGVGEAYQGKRLGAFLLVSALHEMRRAGCRHAAISTTGNNYRAALLYTNLGYRFADETYSFRKEL